MDTIQRFRGSLLGLAVGDALGVALEFKPPGTFEPIADIIGGGSFGLLPGEWTDDTSMALCLAESLIEKGFDLVDQLERYLCWYKEGYLSSRGECFDIGNTVRDALERFARERKPYSGSVDPMSAGNGSIMRLAPVPLFFAGNPREVVKKSGESSRTTHGTRVTVDACRYFGGLIWGAVNGYSREELLSDHFAPVPGIWEEAPLAPEVEQIAAGCFKRRNQPEIKGSGYVVACLEAALWAFYHSMSFREGALLAVNLGDDADTTGAVYGQLAGAYYGEVGIPEEWREKIVRGDMIGEFAEKLFNRSNVG